MKNYKLIVAVVFSLLLPIVSNAQGPGFVDDVEDVAPIPGIVFAIICALGIGIYSLRNKNKS